MKYIQATILSLLCSASLQAATLPDNSGVIDWHYLARDTTPALKSFSLQATDADEKTDGLNYLNTLRTGAGLIPLAWNSSLETAAQNHADYLVLHNLFGHYENETDYPELFTGVYPWDRGIYAGYTGYSTYGENISAGNDTVFDSIDGLFSAIYHRFGFLALTHVDLGIGIARDENYSYHSVYNYDFGNQGSVSATRGLNPGYIAWPYNGFRRAQTSFPNNESPDPLPSCTKYGIAGNPVSIEFNPEKNNSITMSDFQIFDSTGTEITDTTILTKATDPGQMLDENQFVLFPMKSLDVDSGYDVVFSYSEDGTAKNLSWHFNTTRFTESHYLVTSGNTYDVISGREYIIQLKPTDCTLALNSYSYSGYVATMERLNLDLFRISVAGDTDFSFGPYGEFTFTLHVAPTDNAIAPSALPPAPTIVPMLNLLLH